MIFVTLGSQKFQFNRLLQKLDELVENGVITEDIFAQIGYSDYEPKHYRFQQFLARDEFAHWEEKADIVITHGGTGAIIGAVKMGKKVIAVPRLAKYGEHVDDHQLQLISQFKEQNLICGLNDCSELEQGIDYVHNHSFNSYESNTQTIIDAIDKSISDITAPKETTDEARIKVLICGSDRSVKGGISTVIDQLMDHDWGDRLQFSYLATHISGNAVKKSLFFLRAYRKLQKLLKKDAFDIAHIHMSYKGSFYRKYLVAKTCKKNNKKVILHLHGSEFKDFYNNGNAKRKRQISELLTAVDAVVALGNQWRDFVVSIAPQANVQVIHNAVSIPNIEEKVIQQKRTFLFMGTLIQRKGVIDLIHATKQMLDAGVKNFKVLIAGTGEEEANLKAYAEQNMLTDYVDFLGWVDKENKSELLRKSDVLVLPSYNEGLPMAILEAMSYGLPIISTTVGSIAEAVKEGKNGHLVTPGDIDTMAEHMKNYVENGDVWLAHSAASREIAQNVFSDSIFFEKLSKIFWNVSWK